MHNPVESCPFSRWPAPIKHTFRQYLSLLNSFMTFWFFVLYAHTLVDVQRDQCFCIDRRFSNPAFFFFFSRVFFYYRMASFYTSISRMSQQLWALQICVGVMHLQARTKTRHSVFPSLSLNIVLFACGWKRWTDHISLKVIPKLVYYELVESPVNIRTHWFHFRLLFSFCTLLK